jgi:hypothetical protein
MYRALKSGHHGGGGMERARSWRRGKSLIMGSPRSSEWTFAAGNGSAK